MSNQKGGTEKIVFPESGIWRRLLFILKYHLHVILYFYFWFGLFICGLVAPQKQITDLGSNVITKGWHLSLLSVLIILPAPIIYVIRFYLQRERKK